MFTTNYNNLNDNEFHPLPVGEYECTVESAQEQVTKNGKECISIRVSVRSDLDKAMPNTNGKYHKRQIFINEWKRNKEVNGKQKYVYEMKNLMYFLRAVGVPAGTEINSMDEILQALIHKNVRLYINVTEDNYNGQKQQKNTVAPWNWSKTKYPTVSADSVADPFAGQPVTDVDESDLPF